ncbi:hypothetical protein V1499_06665 [Neobacillus sp. SCS-31]|uniref:hypothetical protein n=1 Tax=Neobacillus oceani TaxID=3115292 RepID=UPI00390660CE
MGVTTVEFEIFDHNNVNFARGVNYSEEVSNNMKMGEGKGFENNPPSISKIEKWYVIVRWAGKEEKIELNLGPPSLE